MITQSTIERFQAVQEWDNEFFALFPHRFDYIHAPHPDPKQTPDWQTESRYPLSDRLLQQGSFLFGVRFGSHTNYCLLDIDITSFYHPRHDPLAITRIVAALEPIGLTRYVACTSSYSGGLHLYLPFQQTQSSWELAGVVATLLENAGFVLKPGQLELFPNPKPYKVEGTLSLFNAHRLPMQAGSYLLNEDFEAIWSNQQSFVQQWRLAQAYNDVETKVIKRILKQVQRRHYCISGKADKFINDLNSEIELGWTGYGQTNRLLGRITMRVYIFHHVLVGGNPLAGQALVDKIVETAKSLPGYYEWCRHQHEIEERSEEWAQCIENSHYFHYGSQQGKYKLKEEELLDAVTQLPNWNQQQAEGARERIRKAIADLLDKNSLPSGATARFRILTQYGIGGGSLYRHRDLWHPNHLETSPCKSFDQPTNHAKSACQSSTNSTSLLPTADGDNSLQAGFSHSIAQNFRATGSNTVLYLRLSDLQDVATLLPNRQYIQPSLFDSSTEVETDVLLPKIELPHVAKKVLIHLLKQAQPDCIVMYNIGTNSSLCFYSANSTSSASTADPSMCK